MPDDKKINIIREAADKGNIGKIEKTAPAQEMEKRPEATAQERERVLSEIAKTEKSSPQPQAAPAINSAQNARKIREKKIEKILEKDLADIYVNLPADKKSEFKKLGEETADQINNLLDKTKIKIKEVINLIRKWLMVIPGINKFFLEQEVKIKADEIIKLNISK